MKVLNLRCAHDHRFEGWFVSGDEFESQLRKGVLDCPMCGDKAIERLPSAPHLNTLALREATPPAPQPVDRGAQMQQLWMQAVKHVIDNSEDVGERFPEEARRIHYGEAQERSIRGQATRADADALREEGIEVVSMPVPPALKGPLQ